MSNYKYTKSRAYAVVDKLEDFDPIFRKRFLQINFGLLHFLTFCNNKHFHYAIYIKTFLSFPVPTFFNL